MPVALMLFLAVVIAAALVGGLKPALVASGVSVVIMRLVSSRPTERGR